LNLNNINPLISTKDSQHQWAMRPTAMITMDGSALLLLNALDERHKYPRCWKAIGNFFWPITSTQSASTNGGDAGHSVAMFWLRVQSHIVHQCTWSPLGLAWVNATPFSKRREVMQ